MPSSSRDFPRYAINITATASRELEEIYKYVKENAYELTAHRQEILIIERIRGLEVFPNGYAMMESKPPVRSVRAGRYRIFFLVDDQKKRVEIIHILHARRDIEHIL